MSSSGIYTITCKANGKRYIGSAVNITLRWNSHKSHLNRNIHANAKLQNAWNKYGPDEFEFSVLELVPRDSLLKIEQKWLDAEDVFENGFNINKVAGSRLGIKHTPETKAKMAASARGKTHSAEVRAKISAGNKGKIISDAQRAAIAAANARRSKSIN